ncbi:MAG TPA: threonine synthase [Candidatus Sulfopaludibacter sp.]|nr:threonine synthase [Candidatus Sulfopaludibacter sp.]
MLKATHLECSLCHKRFEAGQVANLCECGGPLLVRYDLDAIRRMWRRRDVPNGPASMWRYAPVLPPADEAVVSLGEGWTPLVHARRLGARLGADSVWVKDEGMNPTASFKARGLSCALSICDELGIKKGAIPSAGNAASALAAYAAAAGIESYIFMPRDVPQANYLECKAYGANVTLVDGLISDCGKMVAERGPQEGWFDVSTLKEPYRIEGKKTMGYEVAEQMDWELPDAIFYPTGGGVGLIGMWKSFQEMEHLGWIGSKRPKMISVQAEGCAPIVRAFEENEPRSRFFENAHTVAAGLRVPKALGDFLVLQGVRESGGTAIAVSDDEMLDAGVQLATDEGVYAAPEGAACVAALQKLLTSGFLKPTDRIVLYNTGSGLKYPEAYSTRFPRTAAGEQDKLGGLITPR